MTGHLGSRLEPERHRKTVPLPALPLSRATRSYLDRTSYCWNDTSSFSPGLSVSTAALHFPSFSLGLL